MKTRMTMAMLGLALVVGLGAQSPADRRVRLIVQGDDMGVAHGINVATIDAYRRGVLRSANVIMTGQWVPEAAALLRANPGIDAGVHLALTSEWTHVKWRPLTHAPSLVDPDGYLFPTVRPRPGMPPRSSLEEAGPHLDEVERELRAQIVLARRLVPHLTYTWEHMGFGGVAPEVRATVRKLTREYGLVTPGPETGVTILRGVWVRADTGAERARKLAAALRGLGPGTYLMVEHAATDSPEMRAFGHPGYEDVAVDRQAVLDAWTSPEVAAAVAERDIELTTLRQVLSPVSR